MTSSNVNSGRTWFLDLDGTIFFHNAYLTLEDGKFDIILPGVRDFFSKVNKNDCIIIASSRADTYKDFTVKSLKHYNIRYDYLLFNLPRGPRILVNDKKVDGTETAYAINILRNSGLSIPDRYYKI
jgi:hypothetical protein